MPASGDPVASPLSPVEGGEEATRLVASAFNDVITLDAAAIPQRGELIFGVETTLSPVAANCLSAWLARAVEVEEVAAEAGPDVAELAGAGEVGELDCAAPLLTWSTASVPPPPPFLTPPIALPTAAPAAGEVEREEASPIVAVVASYVAVVPAAVASPRMDPTPALTPPQTTPSPLPAPVMLPDEKAGRNPCGIVGAVVPIDEAIPPSGAATCPTAASTPSASAPTAPAPTRGAAEEEGETAPVAIASIPVLSIDERRRTAVR